MTATDEEPLYLRQINPRSALIVAAAFNAILGLALALVGYLVIFVASWHGVLDQVNNVTSDLGSGSVQRFSIGRLCLLWTAIVAAWIVVATVLAGLVTLIFNNLLRLLGGLELDVSRTPERQVDLVASTRRVVASVASRLQERAPQLGESELTDAKASK
jgi:hypothetical protein